MAEEKQLDKKNIITMTEVEDLIKEGNGIIVDVRNPEEVESTGKIPTSVNIPIAELPEALQLDEDKFVEKYGVTKPKPDGSNLVTYCMLGIRGQKGTEEAIKLGFTEARHYKGDWNEWNEFHKD